MIDREAAFRALQQPDGVSQSPKHSSTVYVPSRERSGMTLSIGRTLSRGLGRVVSRSGAVLLLLTLAVQFVVLGAMNSLIRSALPPELHAVGIGLALPVSDDVAVALAVAGGILGVVTSVIGPRALARDRSELNALPGSLFTRRIGRATLSALIAGLIVTVSVTLGSLLILPGLFLATSFLFVNFAIAVEDAGPLSALRRSWGLAAGNRWRVFALVFVAFVAFAAINVATGVASLVDLAAAQAINVVVSSVVVVAYLGVVAEAFHRLRGDGERL